MLTAARFAAFGLSALLAIWAAVLPANAQSVEKVHRIGFLGLATPTGFADKVEGFRTGLRELGYVEGENIVIEFRWTEGRYERLPALAAELVALEVDVIVTQATIGVRTAKRATQTIPIVIGAVGGDPVASGLVASLARPGGNVTGSNFFGRELAAKRLELIKAAVPGIERVAVLFHPRDATRRMVKAMSPLAGSLGLQLRTYAVRRVAEFERAFSEMSGGPFDAVAVNEDPLFLTNSKRIAHLATRHRLPLVGYIESVKAGGLLGYGANIAEMHRRAAYFVDRILKGADPAELPIERATKFDLVVNLKTAKALGITFPPSILLRATEVIE